MKYLFFDIECSNCFGGKNKICEIGYVLTDENFNLILKEDIPISPGDKNNKENRFDTTIYKRGSGIVLREPSLILLETIGKSMKVSKIGIDAQRVNGKTSSLK